MELWDKVLHRLSEKQTSADIDEDVLIITVQNEFQADWLRERYKTLIFETVREVAGETMEIEIVDSKRRSYLEYISTEEHLGSSPFDELKNLIMEQQKKIKELEARLDRLEHKNS